jgi:glutathione S-transferase
MASMPIKLYTLPASHPCAAVSAALELKSLQYKRVDLLPMSQLLLGPLLYGGTTVPGLRIGGEKVVGSRAIMRRLDALVPEPPLVPAEEQLRGRVLEVERWGDVVLQSVPRRVIDACFVREPSAMMSYAADAKLPLPTAMLKPAMPLTARAMAMWNSARDASVRADLAALPRQLDLIERWIGEGVLGASEPNAADLQIGSSLALLSSIGDVRPLIDGRPAAELTRYLPPVPGSVPAGVLPADWLPAPAPAA